MSHSEICPICNGSGKYKIYEIHHDISTECFAEYTCHGCGGKGWIIVEDKQPDYGNHITYLY